MAVFDDATPAEFYTVLSRDVLLALRGSTSQHDLSERLGFTFNQVGKWETGATLFHWDDFVRLCGTLGIPWKQQFEDVFSFHTGMKLSEASIFEILSRFFGHANVTEMAELLNKSRSSVSRLLHDQVKMDFADVLRLMDQRPFVLSSWLAKFLDLQKIPTLKSRVEIESKTMQGMLTVPWAAMVNSALGLTEYQAGAEHSRDLLARKTGLTPEMVDLAVQKLVDSGLIQMQKNGKYLAHVREMTFLRVPEFRKVTQFLGKMVADAFQTKVPTPNIANPSLSASRFYPLSDAAGKKIADALVRFHHEVSDIMKHDEGPKSHVRAILIHSIDLELLSKAHVELAAESRRERPEPATV